MSWSTVLSLVLAYCAMPGQTPPQVAECQAKTYMCVHRNAILDPKMEGSDLVSACISNSDLKVPTAPAPSPSPSSSPSPAASKTPEAK